MDKNENFDTLRNLKPEELSPSIKIALNNITPEIKSMSLNVERMSTVGSSLAMGRALETSKLLQNVKTNMLSPSDEVALKNLTSEMKSISLNMERMSTVGSSLAMGRALETSKLLQEIKTNMLSPSIEAALKNMTLEMNRISNLGSSLAMGRAIKTFELINDLNKGGSLSSVHLAIESANNMIEQIDGLSKAVSLEHLFSDLIKENNSMLNTLPDNYIDNIKNLLNNIDTTLDTKSDYSSFEDEYYLGKMGLSQAETDIENVAPLFNQHISMKQYAVIENLLIAINEKIQSENVPQKVTRFIVKSILSQIIIILLVPWFTPIIEQYNDWVDQNRTQIIRMMKKDIREESGVNNYKNYRIVTKHNLNVKLTNQQKSPTIANISLGEIVEVRYKKRNWTKIRIENESITIEGWVFTRYIDKIK